MTLLGLAAAATEETGNALTQALPWLSAVGAILTIASFAAAAAAFYRATAARATIEIQATTITALQQQVEQVLRINAEMKVENARVEADAARKRTEDRAEAARVEGENTILRDALSGKADIERVELLIDTHHRQVMEDRNLDRVSHEGRFDNVDAALRDIKGILALRRARDTKGPEPTA